MKLKNIIISFLLFCILFPCFSFADDEITEDINWPEIEQSIQASSETATTPDINSRAAIVINRDSKTILYGKNETQQRKMASTTKIMTSIVVLENSYLYDTVTISKASASTGGSRLGLKAGDKVSVCDLLYGLMLKSGNDAAVALAEYVGGSISGFAELMNAKAQELGLSNTHFVTPHGLDNDDHYTTAYELALLTDYALQNETFCNIVGTKNYTITINGYPKQLSNTNELLGYLNGVYGVKTGFTNGANRCLVTSCKRDGLDVICVVLGADTKKDRTKDSMKLIEYCFNTYTTVNLHNIVTEEFSNWKTQNISKFAIQKGMPNSGLELEIKDFTYELYPVKKEDVQNININIDCNYNIETPLPANSVIGTLTINITNEEALEYDIINTSSIDRKNIFTFYTEMLGNYLLYFNSK